MPGRPVLFRLPGLSAAVRGTYAAADFAETRVLPWEHATPDRPFPHAVGFARVIDLRDFAFDPGFRGVAMIDFFLDRLGLDPAAVPSTLRRNAWLAARLPPPPAGRGHVLVCPRSSMALRDIPATLHAGLLRWLLAHAGQPVLTQGVPIQGVTAAPWAGNFASLCALVAGAACVVSADTAMVHLADGFGVPTLALFTTHRPDWRVRDYPLCRALHFPAPGLPEALEFARGPEDEAAAAAAWPPLDALVPELEALLSRAGSR
ncbi:MAG TPA: glycosyltransferase family 9 protein [Acetobacteraceae bacterium]|nr:glycosyltransferase family 9 protein [Acetobacteraceae bacterium]